MWMLIQTLGSASSNILNIMAVHIEQRIKPCNLCVLITCKPALPKLTQLATPLQRLQNTFGGLVDDVQCSWWKSPWRATLWPQAAHGPGQDHDCLLSCPNLTVKLFEPTSSVDLCLLLFKMVFLIAVNFCPENSELYVLAPTFHSSAFLLTKWCWDWICLLT